MSHKYERLETEVVVKEWVCEVLLTKCCRLLLPANWSGNWVFSDKMLSLYYKS